VKASESRKEKGKKKEKRRKRKKKRKKKEEKIWEESKTLALPFQENLTETPTSEYKYPNTILLLFSS